MSSTLCSYCCDNGHRLNQCNNNVLIYLAKYVYQMYVYYLLNDEPNLFEFYNIVRRNLNSKELKSICIRFLQGRSGLSKQQYINHIENNIHLLEPNTLDIELEESSHNFVNNFIQQYINNAEQEQEITVVSSTSQVYHYTLVPRNSEDKIINQKKSLNLDVTYISNDVDLDLITCPICLEDNIDITNKIKLNCKHDYCFDCISKVINNNENPKCSLCRETITSLCIQENCNQLHKLDY
jgi:hypothetical protein